MPAIKCPMTDCAYRGKRGSCHAKHVTLKQTRSELNEMYCLNWTTPELRLFIDSIRGEIGSNDDRYSKQMKEYGR